MRIYLAARFARIGEMRDRRDDLVKDGHLVTAHWINDSRKDPDPFVRGRAKRVEESSNTIPADDGREFAQTDWEDINRAHCLVAFTELTDSGPGRGGRHVELGLALALGKKVVVVGPRENIFHTLPAIDQFWDWECARAHLFDYVRYQG